MRSLWAVACAVSVSGLFLLLSGGCAGTKSQVKEFNRMEVGEGPGVVLSQMIELQKEPGGQRIEAHPVLVSPWEGTYAPDFYSSDFSSGNLSMSRATGAMHDVQPAVPPLGNPPLLVQTDVQSGQSSAGDPVPPVSVSPRYSPPPPIRKAPLPVVASAKPPAPAPPVKSPPPAATTARTPVPTPPPVAPRPVVASAQPPVSAESVPTPVPPVPHEMTLKKRAAFQTASRKIPSSPPTVPSTARERKKAVTTEFAGGTNYRIGPEDVLHIDVWGNPELTRDVTVRPDGKISLPLIQDIQAEGLTTAEVSDGIQQKLLAFLKDPEVAVIVTEVNSPKVFVIGNVTKPGPYPLRGDVSVLQALSLAGGFTPFASPKSIKVIHNREGKREVRKVNYYDIIGKRGEGNNLLKPGDTIVVP